MKKLDELKKQMSDKSRVLSDGMLFMKLEDGENFITTCTNLEIALVALEGFSGQGSNLVQHADLSAICDFPKEDWKSYCVNTGAFMREIIQGFLKIQDRGPLHIAFEILEEDSRKKGLWKRLFGKRQNNIGS